MKNRNPARRLTHLRAAVAFAGLALLAACAAHPETPSAHRDAPPLRVGTSGDYPPFSELRDGRVEGFSAALMEAYAAEHGRRLVWVPFRWSGLIADLTAGRFDVAEGGVTVRPDRSLAGRYTVPVARNGAVLLLRRPAWAQGLGTGSEDPLAALKALDRAELRVAVNRGGHLERVARSQFQHARILALPENAAVPRALAAGEADAALTNTVEAPRWASGLAGVESIGPFTRDLVALYVNAGDAGLAAELDTWLLAQEQSGALGKLRARYLGPGATGPTALPVEALLAATAERLALMPFVAAAKQRAGQPIEVPAQEARVLEGARADVRKAATAEDLPAPRDEAVTAFFQAQIDAAKAVQRRTAIDATAPVHSLDDELRPALSRISARLSALLPRVPPGLEQAETRRKARDFLASSGLDGDDMDRIADALVTVSASRSAPVEQPRSTVQ